jgi:hypothetical protein
MGHEYACRDVEKREKTIGFTAPGAWTTILGRDLTL